MLKNLLNIFFPLVCNGCQNLLSTNEKTICINCRHELPLTNHILENQNEAYKKFNGKIPVEHVSSILYYHKKGIVQQLIHNLKYRNHQDIGTFLGDWYAEELISQNSFKEIDFIIPVPLHKKRLKERGYNQVTNFGKALSKKLKIEYTTEILYRKEYTITQSKKNLSDRSKLNNAIFDVTFNKNHHNKHFLLIDDVLTTGATLEACGKALLQIPNAKISIITMAFSQS
jgi:ComF family protein